MKNSLEVTFSEEELRKILLDHLTAKNQLFYQIIKEDTHIDIYVNNSQHGEFINLTIKIMDNDIMIEEFEI